MIVGVLKEEPQEFRVALTPDVWARKRLNATFLLETGAGENAGFSDEAYLQAGAKIASRDEVLEQSHVIFCTRCPDEASLKLLRPETCLMGALQPQQNHATLQQLARLNVFAFALEELPRTTRAQAMDILSSQNNLAGYQALIEAAAQLGRGFPLMMTAAGSVPAAHVLVVGAGIAGLQAIATARRLGAVVSAFDVRSSAKEQVESLGATFIEVPSDEQGEGTGGYAREMSAAYKAAQERRLMEVMATQDVVLTTAQIPNKPAPKIITTAMVQRLKPGGLIMDLAGESGGNCELSQYGQTVSYDGKRIIAPFRILNHIAATASQLFASNLLAFLKTLFEEQNGGISFNRQDELIQATLLTDQGVIIHPSFKNK